MNQNFNKFLSINDSGLGCLLTFLVSAILLTSVGLGWIVNGFLLFLAFLALVPVLAFWGLRWWLQKNLVNAACPVCQYEFTGFNNTECRCPNCGEPLKAENQAFQRITLPGTIDVQAIEVPTKVLEGED